MNALLLDLPRVTRIEHHQADDNAPLRDLASERAAAAARLQNLDDEWSIEGIFEGSAAIVGLITFGLGLAVDDRWLVLPLLASALLLWQTIQGWCPVLPLLRGLGFRTEREIQLERLRLQEIEEGHAALQCPGQDLTRMADGRQDHHIIFGASDKASSAFSLRDFLLSGAQ